MGGEGPGRQRQLETGQGRAGSDSPCPVKPGACGGLLARVGKWIAMSGSATWQLDACKESRHKMREGAKATGASAVRRVAARLLVL